MSEAGSWNEVITEAELLAVSQRLDCNWATFLGYGKDVPFLKMLQI